MHPKKGALRNHYLTLTTEDIVLGADGLQAKSEKIKAVHDMPRPTDVQDVHHLIGLHLSKFLSQLSTICETLHQLPIGNSIFDWLPQHGEVFCKVMEMITKASVLHLSCITPRTGGSLGCALGCDAGGREFETPTGPTLRVFK